MAKVNPAAMAILAMKPKSAEPEESEDDDGDALHMAAVEMLQAVKANDGKALAEALRAAIISCKYED